MYERKLIEKNTYSNRLWLILLFLFSLDAFTYGSYFMVLALGAYAVLNFKKLYLSVTEICLLIFSLTYFLMETLYFGASLASIFNFVLAPWLMYWMGKTMIRQSRDAWMLIRLVKGVAMGFFVHILLNILYSLWVSPPGYGNRVLYDFWDHQYMSVTCCGLMIGMANGTAFGVLRGKSSRLGKLFWISVIVLSVVFSFLWAHRSSVVIMLILLGYNLWEILWNRTESESVKTLVVVLIVLTVSTVMVSMAFDIGGISTWLQGTWLFQRFTNAEVRDSSSRMEIWKAFFLNFLWYPFGGKRMLLSRRTSFAHNLWMDIYHRCGAIPCAAFLAATVLIVKNVFRYCKALKKQGEKTRYYILVNFYLATFLSFMIEPALDANPYVVLSALLISGAVDGAFRNYLEEQSRDQDPVSAPGNM